MNKLSLQTINNLDIKKKIGKFDIKKFLYDLPSTPGVYKFYDSSGVLLYVGKAKNLKKRVSSYFSKTKHSPRIIHMLSKLDHIEFTQVRSESEALLLENNLIKAENPKYNILFRDDKSYPMLKVSNHKFPRISYFRGSINGDAKYFGPFPNSWAVRESIQILQKIFKLRDCTDIVFSNRSRPCMQYQINRCSAPCVGLVTRELYDADVLRALSFLNGKHEIVFNELKRLMEQASKALDFEKAGMFRDQISALSIVIQKHSMESKNDLDCDIFVVISDGFRLAVNTAIIKGGRHLGDKVTFSLPSITEGIDSDPVLEEALLFFLIRYYKHHKLPKTLIVNNQQVEQKFTKWINNIQKLNDESKCNVISMPKGIQADWLDLAKNNAISALKRKGIQAENFKKSTLKLVEFFKIKDKLPDLSLFKIECFDVSHMSGKNTYCSCVVFYNYEMQSSMYRKFIITDEDHVSGDDYNALRKGLIKRYKLKNNLPHVVMVDGGKGQLSVAKKVLKELDIKNTIVISIVKGQNRKVGLEKIIFDKNNIVSFDINDGVLMMLAKIRDEAHRFAITGMRNKRIKEHKKSSLDEIEGIGARRKKSLLERFGGFHELSKASEKELESVVGISKSLAKKIYSHLHC